MKTAMGWDSVGWRRVLFDYIQHLHLEGNVTERITNERMNEELYDNEYNELSK